MSKSLYDTVLAKFTGVAWPQGEGPQPSAQCLRAVAQALGAIGSELGGQCFACPVILDPKGELPVHGARCTRPLEECVENALSMLSRDEWARADLALRCQLSVIKSEHAIVVFAEHTGSDRVPVYHVRSTLYISNYSSRGRPAKLASSFDANLYRRPLRSMATDAPMGTPISELRRASPPSEEEN